MNHNRRARQADEDAVRGFHSFRVTWITMALAAGVPMELVTRVTGHQTVDVVLKHYFRPGREDFRQAIEGAMPKLLMQPSAAGTAATDGVEVLRRPNPPSHEASEGKGVRKEILDICARAIARTPSARSGQASARRWSGIVESPLSSGHLIPLHYITNTQLCQVQNFDEVFRWKMLLPFCPA